MKGRERSLADLGEVALIRRIAARAGRTPDLPWALGIGDDAAILRPRKDDEIILSTDAQVEGVHFRFDREPPRVIGRRALAVNLSDLAAMGAEPTGSLLSLCAPRRMKLSTFDGMIGGFVDESERFDCPLVGGNLSTARQCSLTVTIVGRCRRGRALRRQGVRSGDLLYVTGVLGAAALARSRADRRGTANRRVPVPRVEAGRTLARLRGVRACIDLSDGIASDLAQLLRGTSLGAELDAAMLPAPPGFARACRELRLDPAALQAVGGEDYELLFALSPQSAVLDPRTLSRRLGVPVTRVGRIVRKAGIRGLPEIPREHHF